MPWLFVAPLVIVVLAVFAFPIASLIRYSFQQVGSGDVPSEWVGLQNYELVKDDDLYWRALTNNLRFLLCVPVMIAIAAITSALLHDRVRGWRVYRFLVFLPYVLAIPVVGIVFGYLFKLNGLVNSALETVGLGSLTQDWLGSSDRAIYAIMFVIVWKELGFGIIVFLARLSTVGDELYDAARVDGAGWWSVFRHVTIPALVPAIVFFAVVETITMLSWVFAYVYVMTTGGPGNSTVVTEFYIYQKVFFNNNIGIGAAAAVSLLALVAALIVTRLWALRRFDEEAT